MLIGTYYKKRIRFAKFYNIRKIYQNNIDDLVISIVQTEGFVLCLSERNHIFAFISVMVSNVTIKVKNAIKHHSNNYHFQY